LIISRFYVTHRSAIVCNIFQEALQRELSRCELSREEVMLVLDALVTRG
jgi:hypothetical protein